MQSCGTGAYHVGDEPDERTVAKCQEKVNYSHFDIDYPLPYTEFWIVSYLSGRTHLICSSSDTRRALCGIRLLASDGQEQCPKFNIFPAKGQ